MKSSVAPKVLCLRRGEEGGDMTSGSGETCSRPSMDLCLSAPPKLHQTALCLCPRLQLHEDEGPALLQLSCLLLPSVLSSM